MRSMFLLLAFAALPCTTKACQLSISNLLPEGRISEFSIVGNHVSVQNVDVQAGWALSITNDPSWRASIAGHAIVGAAFLSKEKFFSMFSFQPEPGFSCKLIQETHNTKIIIKFYNQDNVKNFQVNSMDVFFKP